jgi:hypothetical protein
MSILQTNPLALERNPFACFTSSSATSGLSTVGNLILVSVILSALQAIVGISTTAGGDGVKGSRFV